MLKVGDRVTVPARDSRTCWQRWMPRWLGGRDYDPSAVAEMVVTAVSTDVPISLESDDSLRRRILAAEARERSDYLRCVYMASGRELDEFAEDYELSRRTIAQGDAGIPPDASPPSA